MRPGRFFKVDERFDDYSVYEYTSIVSKGKTADSNDTHPVSLILNDTFLSFYIHIKKDNAQGYPISANHELLSLPIAGDNASKEIERVLNNIFNESLEYYPGTYQVQINENSRFNGYIDAYRNAFEDVNSLNDFKFKKIKLVLDFLFDLTHSRVFEDWAGVNQLIRFVRNHFFLNAIVKKNEYYFLRKEFLKANFETTEERNFFYKRLNKGENEWLDVLLDEKANQFSFSNGWFDDVESEMYQVLFKKNVEIDGGSLPYNRHEVKKICLERIEPTPKYRNELKQQRNRILSFFLKRYNYLNAFKYIFQDTFLKLFFKSNQRILSSAGVLMLFVFGFYYWRTDEKMFISSIFTVGTMGLIIPVFLPIAQLLGKGADTIYSFWKYLREKKGDVKPLKYPSYYSIKVCTPKMSISILVGWLAMFPFSYELWELNLMVTKHFVTFWGLLFLILAVVCITIYHEIENVKPIVNRNLNKTKLNKTKLNKTKLNKTKFWDDSFWQNLTTLFKTGIVLLIGFSFSAALGIVMLHLTSLYIYDNKGLLPTSFDLAIEEGNCKGNVTALNTIEFIQLQYASKNIEIPEDSIQSFYKKIEAWNGPSKEPLVETMIQKYEQYLNGRLGNFSREQRIQLDTINPTKVDSIIMSNLRSKVYLSEETLKNDFKLLETEKACQDHIFLKKMAIACENDDSFWIPFMTYHWGRMNKPIFVFPRILMLNALIAFVIGFFIQFITEARIYKEPL